jgi:putative transposase
VANQRIDHARKEVKKLFACFDEVAHEDLNLRALGRGMLSKSFADASWGVFLRCIASKAEEAGKHATPKDPRGTSQRCSGCGEIVLKKLSERVHCCPHCGLTIGRDHNAAINVLFARPVRSGADS